MHIVDGALSLPVIVTGTTLAVGGMAMGLRKLDIERVPAAAMLSAAFFVASLIHVPVGPSSVHLIMSGPAGLVLGWAAFPALFVGLLLQTLFFGFGGLTVLGVNTLNIALPAVIVGALARPFLLSASPRRAAIVGGLAGAGAITLTALLVALSLSLSHEAFWASAQIVLISHISIMLIEGAISAALVSFLRQVKPELLVIPLQTRAGEE